jgi:hypothetical protein
MACVNYLLQATQFCRDIVSQYHEHKQRITSFSAFVRFGPVKNLAEMWIGLCVVCIVFCFVNTIRPVVSRNYQVDYCKAGGGQFYVTSALLQVTAKRISGSKDSTCAE